MINLDSAGELLIVHIVGDIDHHTASEMREKIDNKISVKKPKHLILDFKDVHFMDSSGIGLVLGRYRLMQNFKGTVEIRGVNKHTKRIFELAGIGSVAIIREVQ